MSSQGHNKMSSKPKTKRAAIQLTQRFSEQMAQLCMNDNYADVIFIVENQRLPAHRVILAARSEYFRALLYGGMAETNQREIALDIPLEAFKALLKYVYSGHMPLSMMGEENILDTLGLANQYGLLELELAISEYLHQYLELTNVCAILDAARLYNLEKLTDVCLHFMDCNAQELLQQESFKLLSSDSLTEVLRRDSFFAPEIDIFMGVSKWCKFNTDIDIKSVVELVRLPLIDLQNLLRVVRPTGILEPDRLLDAIAEQTTSNLLPYRAAMLPDQNVATAKFKARVLQGECRSCLLDGDNSGYDMENGYTRHCITDLNDSGIVVELSSIYLLNHIKLLLWDRDNRSYSYYIEVSVNQKQWQRVIDYTQYFCRSWQFLYFEARPVRYIKLVGTHNTVNKVFHVVSLEALHITQMPKIINDIVAPTLNVATTEMSALLVDGVSRTRNALLNGDYVNYDWDSGYTCHQLRSGEILVRLGQPYYLSSMRLLLWDCDDRSYSFYVESSVNGTDWQMVVDKRAEEARSWQNFAFTPRPVIFIKIVGTRNTANEIFHCVHLECPSQDSKFLKSIAAVKELKQQEAMSADKKPSKVNETNENAAAADLEEQPCSSAAAIANAAARQVPEDVLIRLGSCSSNEDIAPKQNT